VVFAPGEEGSAELALRTNVRGEFREGAVKAPGQGVTNHCGKIVMYVVKKEVCVNWVEDLDLLGKGFLEVCRS